MKGRKTPVRCVETGVVYESVNAASTAHFGVRQHLWRALIGMRKTAYGYHWEYVNKEGQP